MSYDEETFGLDSQLNFTLTVNTSAMKVKEDYMFECVVPGNKSGNVSDVIVRTRHQIEMYVAPKCFSPLTYDRLPISPSNKYDQEYWKFYNNTGIVN